jgi:hypothetical protein
VDEDLKIIHKSVSDTLKVHGLIGGQAAIELYRSFSSSIAWPFHGANLLSVVGKDV